MFGQKLASGDVKSIRLGGGISPNGVITLKKLDGADEGTRKVEGVFDGKGDGLGNETTLTVDGNNPLSGRVVVFTLEILGVRDATDEETRAGGAIPDRSVSGRAGATQGEPPPGILEAPTGDVAPCGALQA